MAHRNFEQFSLSLHKYPVSLDCKFLVGATGAVTAGSVKGAGIYAITRLAVGTYKIQFQDSYYKLFAADVISKAAGSGAGVAAGSLTPGVVYQILTLGTTTTAQWITAGVPVGTTPAIGVTFLAAATSAGTGTAQALGLSSGNWQILGEPNVTVAVLGLPAGQGGYVVMQCLAATDAATTTLIPSDPVQGSTVYFNFLLSNGSTYVANEA